MVFQIEQEKSEELIVVREGTCVDLLEAAKLAFVHGYLEEDSVRGQAQNLLGNLLLQHSLLLSDCECQVLGGQNLELHDFVHQSRLSFRS